MAARVSFKEMVEESARVTIRRLLETSCSLTLGRAPWEDFIIPVKVCLEGPWVCQEPKRNRVAIVSRCHDVGNTSL